MNRKPVSSSNLTSVGYDARNQLLEVEFKNGNVYQYFGVPAVEYMALMAAGSHGEYFAANIRLRYQYQQVA